MIVPDQTRFAQIALLSFGLLGAMLIWLFFRPNSRKGE